MGSPICKNCIYFIQHYALNKHNAVAIDCGHCRCVGMKHRKASAKACDHYVRSQEPNDCPDRIKVIRYLTTDILEYIMKLELPPEITPFSFLEK